MATKEPASSRMTFVILAIGGLAVAALLVWALTRTVESPAPVAADTAPSLSTPAETMTTTPTSTLPITATQTPAPFSPTAGVETTASVPRIAVEDLREKMKIGSVTVIDVRAADAFAAAHIPGALNIPFARVESEMSSLPKGKPIVTYCT